MLTQNLFFFFTLTYGLGRLQHPVLVHFLFLSIPSTNINHIMTTIHNNDNNAWTYSPTLLQGPSSQWDFSHHLWRDSHREPFLNHLLLKHQNFIAYTEPFTFYVFAALLWNSRLPYKMSSPSNFCVFLRPTPTQQPAHTITHYHQSIFVSDSPPQYLH